MDWITSYIPIFNNLLLPINKYEKLKKFVYDKNIILNININGIEGCGKLMLIKCILNHCFDLDFNNLIKEDIEYSFLYYYNNVYYVDLINESCDIKLFAKFINKLGRYKTLDNLSKIIIIPNIDKLNNNFLTLISNKSERKDLKFITTSRSIIKLPKKYISSCYKFNLSFMNKDEFKFFYKQFKKKYNITIKLNAAYAFYIKSNYNLKTTILKLQYTLQYPDNTDINIFDKMIVTLLNLCHNKEYIKIKDFLYIILSLNYDCNKLLKAIITVLCKNKIKNMHDIISLTAETSHELSNANQEIFLLEYYFFKLSSLLQK